MPESKEPYQTKISIGDSKVLSTWAAACPRCSGKFRLLWPLSAGYIPLNGTVDTSCPFCGHLFSVAAASLQSCDENDLLAASIVKGLG